MLAPPGHGIEKAIPEEDLLFDEKNPRLATGSIDKSSQESILKDLWNLMAVDEICISIATNGFFENERLLVVPATGKGQKGKYVVVEGNRRLAAIKLLLHAELRTAVRAEAIPKISAEAAQRLANVPVLVYDSPKEVWRYIGVRHINGVMVWDAYSKAVYVDRMIEAGFTVEQVAELVGDRHRTVKRMYEGLRVLQQAEADLGYDLEKNKGAKEKFSHLYTALAYPSFRDYLGIKGQSYDAPKPVKTKKPELRRVMTWLYGDVETGKEPVVVSQNPDLGRLRDVLEARPSREAFESGKFSLDEAFDAALSDQKRLRQTLAKAKSELQKARGLSTAYKGDDETNQVLVDIRGLVDSLATDFQQARAKRR